MTNQRYRIRRTWCFERCGASFITMGGLIGHLKREHGQHWKVRELRSEIGAHAYEYPEEQRP